MNWKEFETRGEDASSAFEALTGQLFERFCRREYGAALREVRFVNGKGGDGGVEVYAVLGSGEEVGLQAKFFRGAFGPDQIRQIEDSLRAARANHPHLMRYVVAIPCNLKDDRDKRAASASTTRRREKSERRRWVEWQEKAKIIAPGTEIALWDEAEIEGRLSERENEGLHAYWFTDSVITLSDLERRFEAAKSGWLSLRYIPHLHAPSLLEQDLSLRLGEPAARSELLREVRAAVGKLSGIRDDVARLGNYPNFTGGIADAQALRDAAIEALNKLVEGGEILASALQTGGLVSGKAPFDHKDTHALRRLHGALERLNDNGRSPIHNTQERLRGLLWESQTPPPILRAWNRWQCATHMVAFLGDPGIGKTHGLAHAVEARLRQEQPALLLRARDCPLTDGWAEILRKALDRPTLGLDALLNALEALVVRADVWRARKSATRGVDAETAEVTAEPTCLLLAVDGLEESGQHERWAELLGELALHLEHHPRIRVAVTLRAASREAILDWVKPEALDTISLPSDSGDVQRLLHAYCKEYGVRLPDRRLRWAIREPLSVRVFCDLSQEDPRWDPHRQDLSLPMLLEGKLAFVERALRDKGGWSRHVQPLRAALTSMALELVRRGRLRRDEAIEAADAALQPSGVLTRERWDWVFEQAAEAGLLLTATATEASEGPRGQTISYVEPAYEPLTDYLIAETASEEIVSALGRRESPKLTGPLAKRPDALKQTAILLAQKGVRLLDSSLWKDDLTADELDSLQLCAIAALDDEAARPYADWVGGCLVASMPSCRRVLAELCVPLARDEAHPFGPRFVHETLLPFLPAKRDLFWSGPSYLLPGNGMKPWEGHGPVALESLTLEPEDRADGPPLLLAWALTSVDSRWRHRLRAELAQWGAGNLDELVRWLDLAMATNDPQMAEDVAMVAFGAACLAGADPKLGALAAWADANLLAPDAPHRREDIVVLHAARGIVERARFMGATVDPAALEYAKRLYSTGSTALPLDPIAAQEADDHYGVSPVTGDLAWYVVPETIQPFFSVHPPYDARRVNPRAERVLAIHAAAAHLDGLTPQKFAFGVVTAHLQAMGWDGHVVDAMDGAIATRHEQETHGARSPVCTLAEKYVWTGCYLIQAYLAGRAPAEADDGPERWVDASRALVEPPVDPVLVSSRIIPNPASDIRVRDAEAKVPWSFWADDGLVAPVDLEARIQVDMANEWVRRAPTPDLRPWVHPPEHAAPAWSTDKEWTVLSCEVMKIEPRSQAYSLLRVASFVVATRDEVAMRRAGRSWSTSQRRDLSEFSEGVRCRVYADPFDACWAPWATGVGGLDRRSAGGAPSDHAQIDVQAASASLTWRNERGETPLRLPAHWLRTALGFAGVERRSRAGGEEWRFMDRRGDVHAVYTRTWAASAEEQREALLVRRSSLAKVLAARGQVLAWAAWLFRAPIPSLYDEAREKETPYACRHWEWLAFLTPSGPDVLELPPFDPGSGASPPPTREAPPEKPHGSGHPPLVRVGPTNPGLATRLETDLDDDNAIPYFLWDDPMTVGEVRQRLATASRPERDRLLGKILREARDPDVWRFTSPEEVAARFDSLSRHLGRRRAFWKFLLDSWEKEGLLVRKSA